MEMPHVSIVTPVGPRYRLSWLQELAQSMLAATTHPIQWIVVSDGEPMREIRQVVRNATRNTSIQVEFVWLRSKRGPSAARNFTLPRVKAPWVMAVDHDDVLMPGSIDSLVSAAEDQKTQWAAGIAMETDEFGNLIGEENTPPFSSRKKLMKNAFFLYRKNHGSYLLNTLGSAIVATSYLREHGWDTSMENWGDHLAFFTLLSKEHEAAWVNLPILQHRNHDTSLQFQHAKAMQEIQQLIYAQLAHLAK